MFLGSFPVLPRLRRFPFGGLLAIFSFLLRSLAVGDLSLDSKDTGSGVVFDPTLLLVSSTSLSLSELTQVAGCNATGARTSSHVEYCARAPLYRLYHEVEVST